MLSAIQDKPPANSALLMLGSWSFLGSKGSTLCNVASENTMNYEVKKCKLRQLFSIINLEWLF